MWQTCIGLHFFFLQGVGPHLDTLLICLPIKICHINRCQLFYVYKFSLIIKQKITKIQINCDKNLSMDF